MWKRASLRFRARLTAQPRSTCRRSCLSTISQSPTREIPRYKRILTIIIAFAAGASFYFVLPDPSRTRRKAALSPKYFIPTTVISNEASGSVTKLLKLAIPPESVPLSNPPNVINSIWSVYIKDDDIQVERPYTPLYGIDKDGHMLFWVKNYPQGEVGRWLHSKKVGEQIELRGPVTTWSWRPDTWDEVVMISGGTGFTPFFQLFDSIISDPLSSPSTHFTWLHSSATFSELPPPLLMEPLTKYSSQHPERFRLSVFVDRQREEQKNEDYDFTVGRINNQYIKESLGLLKEPRSWWPRLFTQNKPELVSKRILFLVCGPEPMISAIAGPYGRNMSQGTVGGILGEMGYTSQQVYKL